MPATHSGLFLWRQLGEAAVDFIERYFGISPDGGDGALEIMLVVLLFMIFVAVWMHLPIIRKIKDDPRNQRRY